MLDSGISIKAQIAHGIAFVEDAWNSIRAGLVRGLSIGFRPLENPTSIHKGGLRWASWEMLEVSCVTVPANSACNVTEVKGLDLPATAGTRPVFFHLQTLDELDAEFCDSTTMTTEIFEQKREAIVKLNARRTKKPVAVNSETATVSRADLRGVVTNVLKNSLTGDAALSARCAALEAKKNQSGDGNYFGGSLERLEALMSAPVKPIYNTDGKLIGAKREMPLTKAEAFEALELRIKELEARPAMTYCGTYREGMGYVPGSVCTLDGSMWHAERTTTARPGASSDWVLCVKHGRDLR